MSNSPHKIGQQRHQPLMLISPKYNFSIVFGKLRDYLKKNNIPYRQIDDYGQFMKDFQANFQQKVMVLIDTSGKQSKQIISAFNQYKPHKHENLRIFLHPNPSHLGGYENLPNIGKVINKYYQLIQQTQLNKRISIRSIHKSPDSSKKQKIYQCIFIKNLSQKIKHPSRTFQLLYEAFAKSGQTKFKTIQQEKMSDIYKNYQARNSLLICHIEQIQKVIKNFKKSINKDKFNFLVYGIDQTYREHVENDKIILSTIDAYEIFRTIADLGFQNEALKNIYEQLKNEINKQKIQEKQINQEKQVIYTFMKQKQEPVKNLESPEEQMKQQIKQQVETLKDQVFYTFMKKQQEPDKNLESPNEQVKQFITQQIETFKKQQQNPIQFLDHNTQDNLVRKDANLDQQKSSSVLKKDIPLEKNVSLSSIPSVKSLKEPQRQQSHSTSHIIEKHSKIENHLTAINSIRNHQELDSPTNSQKEVNKHQRQSQINNNEKNLDKNMKKDEYQQIEVIQSKIIKKRIPAQINKISGQLRTISEKSQTLQNSSKPIEQLKHTNAEEKPKYFISGEVIPEVSEQKNTSEKSKDVVSYKSVEKSEKSGFKQNTESEKKINVKDAQDYYEQIRTQVRDVKYEQQYRKQPNRIATMKRKSTIKVIQPDVVQFASEYEIVQQPSSKLIYKSGYTDGKLNEVSPSQKRITEITANSSVNKNNNLRSLKSVKSLESLNSRNSQLHENQLQKSIVRDSSMSENEPKVYDYQSNTIQVHQPYKPETFKLIKKEQNTMDNFKAVNNLNNISQSQDQIRNKFKDTKHIYYYTHTSLKNIFQEIRNSQILQSRTIAQFQNLRELRYFLNYKQFTSNQLIFIFPQNSDVNNIKDIKFAYASQAYLVYIRDNSSEIHYDQENHQITIEEIADLEQIKADLFQQQSEQKSVFQQNNKQTRSEISEVLLYKKNNKSIQKIILQFPSFKYQRQQFATNKDLVRLLDVYSNHKRIIILSDQFGIEDISNTIDKSGLENFIEINLICVPSRVRQILNVNKGIIWLHNPELENYEKIMNKIESKNGYLTKQTEKNVYIYFDAEQEDKKRAVQTSYPRKYIIKTFTDYEIVEEQINKKLQNRQKFQAILILGQKNKSKINPQLFKRVYSLGRSTNYPKGAIQLSGINELIKILK